MVVLLFWYTRFALKIVNGLLHGPWLGCNHFKGNKFTSSSHMVAKMLVSISLFMLHWFTDLHHLNPDSQLSHEQALLLPFALYEPFWNIITYLKPIFLDFVCCWKAAVLAMSFRMAANGEKFFFFLNSACIETLTVVKWSWTYISFFCSLFVFVFLHMDIHFAYSSQIYHMFKRFSRKVLVKN